MQENKFLLGNSKTIEGSAVNPVTSDNRVIIIPVRIDGEWDKIEFCTQLGKKWSKTRDEYRMWFRGQHGFRMGEVKTVQIQSDTSVSYMVVIDNKGKVDKEAFAKAIKKVSEHCYYNKLNVHMQKIKGMALKNVESTFSESFSKFGINSVIYK